MTKFFNKLKKKNSLGPIFDSLSQFLGQTIPVNPALSRTTSYGFLAPCQNLAKLYSKKTPGQKDERTEGRADPILSDPFGYCRVSRNT